MELKRGRRLLSCVIFLFSKNGRFFFVSLSANIATKKQALLSTARFFFHVDFCSFFTRPLIHETSV